MLYKLHDWHNQISRSLGINMRAEKGVFTVYNGLSNMFVTKRQNPPIHSAHPHCVDNRENYDQVFIDRFHINLAIPLLIRVDCAVEAPEQPSWIFLMFANQTVQKF
jgi:hypothetical protein